MTKYSDWDIDLLADVDVLVGGTPCQAFSVAGLREGLEDERGQLTITYIKLLDLPIKEVREHFNITSQYTWAIARLEDRAKEILKSKDWFNRGDELSYIEKSIEHYRGNLTEWYMY